VNQNPVTLPQQLGEWSRTDPPERIIASSIFDYMNGAGELYLAYRFRYLDVYRYLDEAEEEILVELYRMETPDDAFGLLSLDWGGERMELGSPSTDPSAAAPASLVPARALYGAGLLRMISGTLYARIMAYRESDSSRQAILEIAGILASGQPEPNPPRLLAALPEVGPPGFVRQPGRSSYFRSHLVLNSIYFLSLKNILALSTDAEAVIASYSSPHSGSGPVRLVLIRYPDRETAERGLREFQSAYLAQTDLDAGQPPAPGDGVVRAIEDGWAGCIGMGRAAALVFECPDEATATQFLEKCRKAMTILEANHE
jgi:hypothetical protein